MEAFQVIKPQKLHFGRQKRLHQNLGNFGFHPLPPDQNVLIFNYKKLGFQVDPLPPFRSMSLNILSFFATASHTVIIDFSFK